MTRWADREGFSRVWLYWLLLISILLGSSLAILVKHLWAQVGA